MSSQFDDELAGGFYGDTTKGVPGPPVDPDEGETAMFMVGAGIGADTSKLHRPGFPVIEIFGPVVQGEGPAAGRPCYFVRFGGCDYRCSWCDSMYAVDPAEVRANATRMTHKEIYAAIKALPPGPSLVILSGGNPALHDLHPLVCELHARGLHAHVETQGSVWRTWLQTVDKLIISPKGPSSGMDTLAHTVQRREFMEHVYEARRAGVDWVAFKIVVFDDADYAFAGAIHAEYPEVPFYLSVGTPQDNMHNTTIVRAAVGDRYKWLCGKAQCDPDMSDAVILPQLHVIAHGTERGV